MGRGTRGEGATTGTGAYTQEGHAITDEPASPHPQSAPHDPGRRTPARMLSCNTDWTPHKPHRVAPTGHRNPHQGRRVHPHGEKGLDPPEEPPRTPPSPPPHPNRQAATKLTARATTQATAQVPEEGGDTDAGPRTGDGKKAEGQDRRGPNAPEEATAHQHTEPKHA